MESCCRVCSRSDEFRRFSLYAVAEVSQEVIANMIRDTSDTQVSSEDGLPQHICPDCLMTLSLAFSFRKQCRRSDAKFREYWGGRTPSQSIDQQQQQQHPPRRSQSQVPDDSSFEAATNIKEEVDIYDYEYSVPSHDNQWVIQNPRTIGEGAMTVVHNSGQYHDEFAAAAAASANDGSGFDRDGSVLPMVTTHLMEGHDPSEMGESSGLAQKGEKSKKKPLTPERYSQRIRRQEVSTTGSSIAVPRISEPEWSRFSVNVFQEGPAASTSEKTATNSGQLRCEHCKKKMKKPYKHRNGKCLVSKNKSASRPKCAYCHQTFVTSKGIPGHLRNSCRIYRQVCEAKGIGLPVFNQQTDHSSSPAVTPSASVTNETPEPKIASPVQSIHFEQKPRMKRTKTSKWNSRFSCQYCGKKFTKKSNLIRHEQRQCETLLRTHDEENISAIKTTTSNVVVSVPLPLRESQDDKSAIVKDQHNLDKLPEVDTKCVYCQQNVNKKARFLHHNGRCVLGRVNADHPCPYCPEAFTTRSLLQKHRCQPLQEEQNEQNNVEAAVPSDPQPPERKQRKTSKLAAKQLAREKTPLRETSRKRRNRVLDVSPKSIVKREFCTYCRQRIKESDRQKHKEKRCFNNNETTYNCGYCRKSFAARDSLIEHQRVCTVRKQHKQVKCQFCGAMISNRGNLKKHQKVYCKSVKRGNDVVKPEKPLVVKAEKPIKKKKRVKKEVQEEDVENIPLKQRKVKPKSNASTEDKTKKKQASKKHRFPCENCKLTFVTESRARKHGSKCSAKPTTQSFICEYCSQRFSTKSNMYRHQRLMCNKVDPDEDIVNETIKEFSKPKTIEASHSTVEKKDDQEQSDPTPIEDPRSSDPNPAPCTEQSRTESVQTPMSNDDEDGNDENGEECAPEPEAEEEIIIPEEHLPMENEKVGVVNNAQAEEEIIVPEEHLPMEQEEVVVAVELHDDDRHVEPDNNNAEVEKAPTEAVRLPTVAPVIERNEDSQHDEQQLSTAEEIVPDCDSEREPVHVEHSAD